jgi:hypothetical protein
MTAVADQWAVAVREPNDRFNPSAGYIVVVPEQASEPNARGIYADRQRGYLTRGVVNHVLGGRCRSRTIELNCSTPQWVSVLQSCAATEHRRRGRNPHTMRDTTAAAAMSTSRGRTPSRINACHAHPTRSSQRAHRSGHPTDTAAITRADNTVHASERSSPGGAGPTDRPTSLTPTRPPPTTHATSASDEKSAHQPTAVRLMDNWCCP